MVRRSSNRHSRWSNNNSLYIIVSSRSHNRHGSFYCRLDEFLSRIPHTIYNKRRSCMNNILASINCCLDTCFISEISFNQFKLIKKISKCFLKWCNLLWVSLWSDSSFYSIFTMLQKFKADAGPQKSWNASYNNYRFWWFHLKIFLIQSKL